MMPSMFDKGHYHIFIGRSEAQLLPEMHADFGDYEKISDISESRWAIIVRRF
jgi:hypothetical protein